MPTEHEFKYVLKINKDILQELSSIFSEDVVYIDQGYLNTNPVIRIRVKTHEGCESSYILTTKVKTPIRLIEIEQEIDKRDGEELWKLCNKKLKKKRFQIYDGTINVIWMVELDCFYSLENIDGDPYFIMAEIEMPEGMSRPELPEFLQKHLLYEVPLTDNRFSNTNLGDVEYTTRLYQNLLKEESENAKVRCSKEDASCQVLLPRNSPHSPCSSNGCDD